MTRRVLEKLCPENASDDFLIPIRARGKRQWHEQACSCSVTPCTRGVITDVQLLLNTRIIGEEGAPQSRELSSR